MKCSFAVGTIAKGAALLHQEGAREVYACCTHAVFRYHLASVWSFLLSLSMLGWSFLSTPVVKLLFPSLIWPVWNPPSLAFSFHNLVSWSTSLESDRAWVVLILQIYASKMPKTFSPSTTSNNRFIDLSLVLG